MLKFQSNKCPICRTPVRAMLHVKIRKKSETDAENISLSDTEKEEEEISLSSKTNKKKEIDDDSLLVSGEETSSL